MISEIDIEDMGPPQIELKVLKENEDGSAECTISMNPAGTHLLIAMGFTALIKKAADEVHTDR